jgi:hypothetical protein
MLNESAARCRGGLRAAFEQEPDQRWIPGAGDREEESGSRPHEPVPSRKRPASRGTRSTRGATDCARGGQLSRAERLVVQQSLGRFEIQPLNRLDDRRLRPCSPVHPLTRSPVHPLTGSPVHPVTGSAVDRSPVHPFTRSPVPPLTVHRFTRSPVVASHPNL